MYNGTTPLHIACLNGNIREAVYLVGRGAFINVGNREGDTPLVFAIRSKNVSLVKFLLEHGARKRTRNVYGESPFCNAFGNTMRKTIAMYGNP